MIPAPVLLNNHDKWHSGNSGTPATCVDQGRSHQAYDRQSYVQMYECKIMLEWEANPQERWSAEERPGYGGRCVWMAMRKDSRSQHQAPPHTLETTTSALESSRPTLCPHVLLLYPSLIATSTMRATALQRAGTCGSSVQVQQRRVVRSSFASPCVRGRALSVVVRAGPAVDGEALRLKLTNHTIPHAL